MRQAVHFAHAVNQRKATDYYSLLCLHASVNGRKVTGSFEEMFPQYSDTPPAEVLVDQSPETVKLMDSLADKIHADLKAEYENARS